MLMIELIGNVFNTLAVAGCLLILILILAHIYLLGLHFTLRKKGIAQEEEMLSKKLPVDALLPDMVVQMPVFNEGKIIVPAIAALASLNWPREKLHIQICDDSDDETTAYARDAIASYAKRGTDIILIRRDDRLHFKAGNLRNAMAQSTHDYFAIFDVDYRPNPDFLKRCMQVLLTDSEIGFVQARSDFLNSNENILTRAQTMVLDAHYVEQATRTWAGHPLPFNGTGGIWRRTAIEAGGGWQGETLAEDMDLTYKAWLTGWRGVFLTSVTVLSELPSNISAWAIQQKRWTSGSSQMVSAHLPTIMSNYRTLASSQRDLLLQLFLLTESFVFAMTFCAGILAVLFKPTTINFVGPIILALILTRAIVMFAEQWIGHKLFRRRGTLPQLLFNFSCAFVLCLYPIWISIRYLSWTIPGHKIIFERTPKKH